MMTDWLRSELGISLNAHGVESTLDIADALALSDRAILVTRRHALAVVRLNGELYILDPAALGPVTVDDTTALESLVNAGVDYVLTEAPIDSDLPPLLSARRATAESDDSSDAGRSDSEEPEELRARAGRRRRARRAIIDSDSDSSDTPPDAPPRSKCRRAAAPMRSDSGESADPDPSDSDETRAPASRRRPTRRAVIDSDSSQDPPSVDPPDAQPTAPPARQVPNRGPRQHPRGSSSAPAALAAQHRADRLWDIAHVVEVLSRWKAQDAVDLDEDPVSISGWSGSCFDSAPPQPGHARVSHINARTLGVTAARGSRDAQESMWKVLARLSISCACFSDTGLADPTPLDPMSSLKKTRTIAKFSWKQRQSVLTHGQGSPGLLKLAVGGTMVATDDQFSRILGIEIVDPRGWGRYTGRFLTGKEGTSVILITAYFPCTSGKSSPGSAWQTQLALMQALPESERLRDPWFQCLADLQRTVWTLLNEGASAGMLSKRRVILSADFNAKWVNPKPEASESQQRTRALRAFAKLLGLTEPMSYLHPSARPQTFFKSEAAGAKSSWIDFFLVSTVLLDQGLIMEAGVLQHEQVNNSDHRLSVIDVNIDALLLLGDGWADQPQRDPKLQRLPLQCPKTSSEFQCRSLELWAEHAGQGCLDAAVAAVDVWSASRDHCADAAGDSDWGTVDPVVLAHLDATFEVLMTVTVGAWRKAQNCLPAYQKTGARRKDGWSPVCVTKMRNLRCLLDILSMWSRGTCSREDLLRRASDLVDMPRTQGAAPSPNAYHVDWRQWIAHVRSRLPVVRGELHGANRKLLQEEMQEATDKRDERWRKGKRKACIANWIQKTRSSGPMRSTIVDGVAGERTLVLGEVPLRNCLDTRFEHWLSERLFQQTPLDTFWYESNGGHLLVRPEGRPMRVRASKGLLSASEIASVPERYHVVLNEAAVKDVPSLQEPLTAERYAGCMQPIGPANWHRYWARTKKSTAPGSSQMSVNMVWTLQMDVDHSRNDEHSRKYTPPDLPKGEKSCLTEHIFDAFRVFVNLVIATGIAPTRLLAEVLYPLDKVDGLVDLANKRPIGLVEVVIQSLFGLQFEIVERTWERDGILSAVQCGYTRKKTCEFPVMDLTTKAEYAYIHRTFLAILWMDQSKAFDTLHLYLGIEMPLRRLAVPEKLITMTVNTKYGSWCMVATVHGPTESDWQNIVSRPQHGINKLLPDPSLVGGTFGFDPTRGATQGSKHGTSVFKAYFDWKVTLQERFGFDLAPYRGAMGNVSASLGNALADDCNYTNSTLDGSLNAMRIAALFFAFMGGCLNLDKTNLTLLEWVLAPDGTPTDRYKVHCPDGVDWDQCYHLPRSVEVSDPRTLDKIETTEAVLDVALAGLPVAALGWDTDSALVLPTHELIAALRSRLSKLRLKLRAVVNILAPDDAVKYLGVWLPASLRYNTALSEARTELTTIAECLQCASITPAQLTEVVRMTVLQLGSYRLRMTSLFPEQLDTVDTRVTQVVKQRMHLCTSHPTLAFASALHVTLTNQILVDKICMFLRMVEARHTVSDAIKGSLWSLQRWVGSHTPALEYAHVEDIGWNGTWIGSLAICIRRVDISIVGGTGIPHMREGDACLVDLARPEDRKLVALGCWTHSVWRISDLLTGGGDRSADFASSAWLAPAGWRDKVTDLLEGWTDSDLAPLGAWNPDTIHDRRYLMCRLHACSDRLDMVRVVGMEWDTLSCVVLPRVARRRLGRHALDGHETFDDWLDLLGGCGCDCAPTCDESDHTASCYVWVDSADDPALPSIVLPRSGAIPCGYTARSGRLNSGTSTTATTFIAVDDGPLALGIQEVALSIPSDVLGGVDVDTIVGRSFTDPALSQRVTCARRGAWARSVVEATGDSILYTYSDCSLIKRDGVSLLSYGWVTAGLCDPALIVTNDPLTWPAISDTKLDFMSLEHGAWGGGRVSGPQLDMSTSRGEAFGVIAVMLFALDLLAQPSTPRALRIWSFCDNKGVCDRLNADPDVHGDHDPGIDPDVWALLFALKARLGHNFRLTWQRSHPELRKARAAYHRHNWGNSWSDVLADRAMVSIRAVDERPYLGSSMSWGVQWGGELVTKDIRRSVLGALKSESFVRYLRDTRGWDPGVLEGFPKDRWRARLPLLGDASAAVVLNKFITGWLATLTVQAKRSSDPDFCTACRLCGAAKETNWHVLAECVHPVMAKARTELMGKILTHIEALPLPLGVKQLVSLNWLVADDGALVDLSTDQSLATSMAAWAPELAATIDAVDLRQRLMWDTAQGKHTDDLRKWAFKGVLPAQWHSLLASQGVPPQLARSALLGIEKLVCDTSPELWREFCAKVHQDSAPNRSGTSLTDRIRAAFVAWDGPVPHRLESDVLKWTPKAQRVWLAKLTRRRNHAARLEMVQASDVERRREVQQRISSHFPALPRRAQAPARRSLAVRGLRFADRAKRIAKARRLRQASLRDFGCEPSALGPLPHDGRPLGSSPDTLRATADVVATLRPARVATLVAQPTPQAHPFLYRVTLPPTPADDLDVASWVAGGRPSLGYDDTAGHSATITRTNAMLLLSPVAHLGPDFYEVMMALFAPVDRFDFPHSAPYAASFHARLLAAPLHEPIPRRGGWFALYAKAVPALAAQVAVPGHRGICIPIYAERHWVLVVLTLHDAAFTVYNSMAAQGHGTETALAAIGTIKAKLDVLATELHLAIDWGPTTLATPDAVAQQYDVTNPACSGGDCLLFVGCWSLCIQAGAALTPHTVTQLHMRDVRTQLFLALLDKDRAMGACDLTLSPASPLGVPSLPAVRRPRSADCEVAPPAKRRRTAGLQPGLPANITPDPPAPMPPARKRSVLDMLLDPSPSSATGEAVVPPCGPPLARHPTATKKPRQTRTSRKRPPPSSRIEGGVKHPSGAPQRPCIPKRLRQTQLSRKRGPPTGPPDAPPPKSSHNQSNQDMDETQGQHPYG
jgi:hypothetical protein